MSSPNHTALVELVKCFEGRIISSLSPKILIELGLRQFEVPDVSLQDNDMMILTSDFSQGCPFPKLDF